MSIQRLKRWESPRKEGRNDKGRGGSARQRQLRKRNQLLRKKLKSEGENQQNKERGSDRSLSFFGVVFKFLRTVTSNQIDL
ncbi:hypothetical protein [Merismopedia glauca]|uniref:Uncharacterized protein n=1 Tax=Merismopedia glauca CCAP 1448/3 TaxID=1296344 RepID=A0A2T1BZ94_9CYAN|nr:hypothetical protein [Merismopedia glauca]PSB01321.1 hypothetical protein C7B64_18995 [Merismopedia glauca CCAP 1448/3]